MMYGEIYGYAHYLQTSYFIPKLVEYFWYDVVCKFWPWLQKHDGESSKKNETSIICSAHVRQGTLVVFSGRWSLKKNRF